MCETNGTMRDNSIQLEATVDNLSQIMAFLDVRLDAWECPPKIRKSIELAVEEIYVNIASYAYAPGTGDALMQVCLEESPRAIVITFVDQGTPYDPLMKEEPDVNLPAGERQIGGLGIFLAKTIMDNMAYEYREGSNRLTMRKEL